MTDTLFGKIKHIEFGYGGYQEVQLGLSLTLEGKGWGTNDFKGYWSMEPDEGAKWTVKDQEKSYVEVVRLIQKLLDDAKVTKLSDLKNKPVEVIFKDNILQSWRILTEVL